MAESTFPVDLHNPGQVFAALGLLEAAEFLCGDARGAFDWNKKTDVRFKLVAAGDEDPVYQVLSFLATAEVRANVPRGWRPKEDPEKELRKVFKEDEQKKREELVKKREKLEKELAQAHAVDAFPICRPDTSSAMPIEITGRCGRMVSLGHWADGSSREDFKLYSGNRSALDIAEAMLLGVRDKPKKGQNRGDLKTRGVSQLWERDKSELIQRPFHVLTPMGGSFNFDPRGAWTSIDVGYSPNIQGHLVVASPIVEILAAWGLENARPRVSRNHRPYRVKYGTWADPLPPILARVALASDFPPLTLRRFQFEFATSGKNKIVTFAQEENAP